MGRELAAPTLHDKQNDSDEGEEDKRGKAYANLNLADVQDDVWYFFF